jgi:GNAT superfamily N-acetyltransferase
VILPNPSALHAAVAATWPAASLRQAGPFLIREGRRGGSRVSAATALDLVSGSDVPVAEAAMRDLGQVPLFMVRDGEETLDAILARRGYVVKDPVIAFAAPVDLVATAATRQFRTFEVWPPLAVQTEIWAEGHIGPERLAIMHRVAGPKTSVLARIDDSPAGTGFVACDGPLAMLHALEVRPVHRRRGLGAALVRASAIWAGRNGASHLSLMVTRANSAAIALYASLGMVAAAKYHYRIPADEKQ